MKPMSNKDYAKEVMKLANPQKSFVPQAFYDPDGDCIEFLSTSEDFYAERIDDLVTVYYSQNSDQLIGSLIKNVRKFYQEVLSKYPAFGIVVHDGRIRLSHLFVARLLSKQFQPNEVTLLVYKNLIKCVEENQAEAEMSLTSTSN